MQRESAAPSRYLILPAAVRSRWPVSLGTGRTRCPVMLLYLRAVPNELLLKPPEKQKDTTLTLI
jgi:hypothetical protein